MARCPTCGQETPIRGAGEALARAMKVAHHTGAAVYHTNEGGYAIEYGGGRTDLAAIESAIANGLIQSKWSHLPDGYWVLTPKGRKV
jgi:hypothetical protein